jgi:hypothetical protein
LCGRFTTQLFSPDMPPHGSKTGPSLLKIQPRGAVSPDDIRHRLMERDRQEAADTRTAAQRWLGDPPPHQSALARRATVPEKPRAEPEVFHSTK